MAAKMVSAKFRKKRAKLEGDSQWVAFLFFRRNHVSDWLRIFTAALALGLFALTRLVSLSLDALFAADSRGGILVYRDVFKHKLLIFAVFL